MDRDDRTNDPSVAPASALTRRGALAGAGAAGLLGLLAGSGLGRLTAAAQKATPAGTTLPGYPTDVPPGGVGAAVETLNSGAAPGAPGYSLQLLRFTFGPGATIAPHYYAGAQAGWVASGDLAITRLGGLDAVLRRAPAAGTPGPVEQLALGVETVLHPEDALFDSGSEHWVRNTGSAPCVIYVSALYKEGRRAPPSSTTRARRSPSPRPAGPVVGEEPPRLPPSAPAVIAGGAFAQTTQRLAEVALERPIVGTDSLPTRQTTVRDADHGTTYPAPHPNEPPQEVAPPRLSNTPPLV
jgi:quercetin dioxygenase-like cupin family protein